MLHPKNNTPPPDPQDSQPEIRGFIYHSVCVEFEEMEFISSWAPCMNLGLATELFEMLQPLFPGARVFIQGCAGRADEFEHVQLSASMHKDLILSCRDAEYPGRTYLERVSMYRDGCAPRKSNPSKRDAGGEA